jgi:two-component system, OmpR family, alkaline phosphatase synthesis response regulator PhoP
MAKENILAVEDDDDIGELLKYTLLKEGYQTSLVLSGEDALKTAVSGKYDLFLLDLMLPGIDGLTLCKTLKADPNTAHTPVIMITAKGEEADVVAGLELGADDYIVKPFSPRVLIARIRAVLRRHKTPVESSEAPLKIGELAIHPGRREVHLKDKPIDLTYTEFQLLYHLAKRPGWVFTRYQIVNAVKGEDYPVTDRSVDVQIVGLRKKLGSFGSNIETIRGVGYRFTDPETVSEE